MRLYIGSMAVTLHPIKGNMAENKNETICLEADRLVNGDRQWSYDHPYDNCKRIGQIWGIILDKDEPIPPHKVALMMAGLKIAREIHRHTRDNLVDLAGYAQVAQMVHERENEMKDI